MHAAGGSNSMLPPLLLLLLEEEEGAAAAAADPGSLSGGGTGPGGGASAETLSSAIVIRSGRDEKARYLSYSSLSVSLSLSALSPFLSLTVEVRILHNPALRLSVGKCFALYRGPILFITMVLPIRRPMTAKRLGDPVIHTNNISLIGR